MISEVYRICDAYESGVGHGQKDDKHDNKSSDLYAEKDMNEAYQIGYAFGLRKNKGKQND